MRDAVHPERILRFGTFELDLESEELRRNGLKLKLSGQPLQVLAILLERPGRVVTREELQKRLWPDTFVDVDHNLNTAINKIREVLGDSAENPRFVETLPRRGYRFIASASGWQTNGTTGTSSQIDDPDGQALLHAEPEKSSTRAAGTGTLHPFVWASVVLGAIVLSALLIAGFVYLRRPLPPPHITEFVRLTLDGKHKFPIGADSSRLYMNLGEAPRGAGTISLSGGEVTRIPFDVPKPSPFIAAVSPDGTRLLAWGNGDFGEGELWNVERLWTFRALPHESLGCHMVSRRETGSLFQCARRSLCHLKRRWGAKTCPAFPCRAWRETPHTESKLVS